jgi:sporulation protein YlmC with PRC-barrel domain
MKSLGTFLLATSLVGLPLTAAIAQSQSPSGSSSSPSMQGQSSGSQQGVQIAANSIIGSKVRSPEGKDIGEVSQLLIDPQQGKVTSAVISMGGTLGVGAKQVTVPWEQMKVARDQQQKVVVTMDQQVLQQAPPSAEERQQDQKKQQTGSGDQSSPSASPSTESSPKK